MTRSVIFHSLAGTKMPADLLRVIDDQAAEIIIKGDPFPVTVNIEQIEEITDMTDTATKPRTARELRDEAKALEISGYSNMSKAELAAAVEAAEAARNGTSVPRRRKSKAKAAPPVEEAVVEEAVVEEAPVEEAPVEEEAPVSKTSRAKPRKTSTSRAAATRKAPSKKATPKKAPSRKKTPPDVAEAKKKGAKKPLPMKHRAGRPSKAEAEIIERQGPNPYRRGTNIWYVTEQLLKGGKRQTLVSRLKKSGKLEFTDQVREKEGFDEDAEIDHRLRVIGYTLRNEYGFGYLLKGRGLSAWIQVFPPEAKDEIPEKFADDVSWETHGGKYLKVAQ